MSPSKSQFRSENLQLNPLTSVSVSTPGSDAKFFRAGTNTEPFELKFWVNQVKIKIKNFTEEIFEILFFCRPKLDFSTGVHLFSDEFPAQTPFDGNNLLSCCLDHLDCTQTHTESVCDIPNGPEADPGPGLLEKSSVRLFSSPKIDGRARK